MIYLLSYCPLANSKYGREVATRIGIPSYVDASCRREPDFELASPFVSGLCRPNFIATLNVGDLLVYVTKMSTVHREGRRLVAVLQLDMAFVSHAAAAAWYQASGVRLPHSCIVPGNDPLAITVTNPKMTPGTAKFTDSKLWDRAVYAPRAKGCTQCFSCSALFLNFIQKHRRSIRVSRPDGRSGPGGGASRIGQSRPRRARSATLPTGPAGCGSTAGRPVFQGTR